jgi:hypothetical protein
MGPRLRRAVDPSRPADAGRGQRLTSDEDTDTDRDADDNRESATVATARMTGLLAAAADLVKLGLGQFHWFTKDVFHHFTPFWLTRSLP